MPHRDDSRRGEGRVLATRWAVALLLVLSLLPYANTPRGGFVFDDHQLIKQPLSRPGGVTPLGALTQPYWIIAPNARLWRPVTSATFAIDWKLSHGRPAFFHLINLLLHAGTTILLFFGLRRLGARPVLALGAASIFAVHPLHTEAVTWIAGRAELLAAGFALGALLLSLARTPWLAWLTPLAGFLAVASKESAATLPLLLLFTRCGMTAREKRPAWNIVSASFGVVLIYLVLRRAVVGAWTGPQTPPIDNPMSGMGLFQRLPMVLDVSGRYLSLLFWPDRLSIDYSASVLTFVRGVTIYAVFGAAALVALLLLAIRRHRNLIGWGAGFALLTFALTSNLPFVIGTIMAERLLYLPSAGLILVVVSAMAALARGMAVEARSVDATAASPPSVTPLNTRRRSLTGAVLPAFLVVVVVACCFRTWHRNQDYRNDVTLFTAALRTAPASPKIRTNLALWLYKANRYEEAITQARAALRLEPNIRDARDIVASSLEILGRTDESIGFLKSELTHDPEDRFSRAHLQELLRAAGRQAEADSIMRAGQRVRGGTTR
jgi:protein O-mannosyl-transferase